MYKLRISGAVVSVTFWETPWNNCSSQLCGLFFYYSLFHYSTCFGNIFNSMWVSPPCKKDLLNQFRSILVYTILWRTPLCFISRKKIPLHWLSKNWLDIFKKIMIMILLSIRVNFLIDFELLPTVNFDEFFHSNGNKKGKYWINNFTDDV